MKEQSVQNVWVKKMSETVDYYGYANNFNNKFEQKSFVRLAKKFQEAKVHIEGLNVSFEVIQGYRGFGLNCGEVLLAHFREWTDKHPQVRITVDVTYTTYHTETEFIRGNGS